MGDEKKNILIVDDDKNFLLSLTDGLILKNSDFNIITAEDGETAIKSLNKGDIDIVISDLKMPKVDGFQLLAYISNYYSTIPVIMITAFGTPDIEKELISLGMFRLLEKPIDFELLLENINNAFEAKANLKQDSFSLYSFIQLIRVQKETYTLDIKNESSEGKIFIKNGELMEAIAGKERGEQAFNKIMFWERPILKVIRECEITEKKVSTTLEKLLYKIKQKKENDMISEKQLEPISKIGGFLASAVYTSDGQLVISKKKSNADLDISMISAMAVELFKATRTITEGMRIGTPDTITIKTESTIFIHNCIVTGASGIGVILELDGNIGLAQLTLKNLVKEIKPYFA